MRRSFLDGFMVFVVESRSVVRILWMQEIGGDYSEFDFLVDLTRLEILGNKENMGCYTRVIGALEKPKRCLSTRVHLDQADQPGAEDRRQW